MHANVNAAVNVLFIHACIEFLFAFERNADKQSMLFLQNQFLSRGSEEESCDT